MYEDDFALEAILIARGMGKRAENRLRTEINTEADARRDADTDLERRLEQKITEAIDGLEIASMEEIIEMLDEKLAGVPNGNEMRF